jgi:hypothetical protein
MSRLADGRYRCPRCEGAFEVDAMTLGVTYCRPCAREAAREGYARRMAAQRTGQKIRPRRNEPPHDFAASAPGRTDETLAAMYDVCERTIRCWRGVLGIKPGRRTNRPVDFDVVAKDMTMPDVVARWGVHEGTAYRWLREARGKKPPQGYALPVPADWSEVCATRHALATAKHYGVSRNTVARWARVSGVSPLVGKPGGPRRDQSRRSRSAARKPAPPASTRPELRSVPSAPVERTNGCTDCTPKSQCRACTAAQVQADIDAWLAAGNRPHEVPVGVSGRVAA